jgi:hypothetical protein
VSLRPDEQQLLGQIEQTLQVCDPKLAGMLSIFTRLTAHERMPPQEGPLTVPTAQNTARRAAAAPPGGMSLQGTASTRNSSNLNVGAIVFLTSALIIIIIIILLLVLIGL